MAGFQQLTRRLERGTRLGGSTVGLRYEEGNGMAGYSGTPLVKKLGIKDGFRIALMNAPPGIEKELVGLPANVRLLFRASKRIDFVLLFTKSASTLEREFARCAAMLVPNGMLWVAWPKKASGLLTDLSDNNVRQIGLDAGLVDVKVCAINDVWSGLKFVYRVKDRVIRK